MTKCAVAAAQATAAKPDNTYRINAWVMAAFAATFAFFTCTMVYSYGILTYFPQDLGIGTKHPAAGLLFIVVYAFLTMAFMIATAAYGMLHVLTEKK